MISNIGNQGEKLSRKSFQMKIFKRMNWRVSFTDFRKASVVTVDLIVFENERVEN